MATYNCLDAPGRFEINICIINAFKFSAIEMKSKKLISFAGVFAACAALSAAEYNYAGLGDYYSIDDPGSWSPTPEDGVKNSYSWFAGKTFVFDSVAVPDAAAGAEVKYFSDENQPHIEKLILKTSASLNGAEGGAYAPTITVDNLEMYSDAESGLNHKLLRFRQIKIGSATIGANSASPVAKTTIFHMSFRDNGSAYYYNSAADSFVSADIGRVTLNGALPTNPNDQNTVLWYLNDQAGDNKTSSVAVVRVNGIDGVGIVRNNFANDASGTTTLVFSNTSDASFKGILMDDWVDPSKFAKLHIVMDGAAGATQTIRQTSDWDTSVWNRADLDSVGTTIKNGTLAISSAPKGSSMVESARVRIEGGALAVAQTDADGAGGSLRVRGVDWVGGKIKVDINRGQLLSTNGIAQLGGDGAKYVFEVDLSDFAPDTAFEGDEFSLLVSDSGSFGDISKYEAEFVYNGVEISGLEYEILSTAHGLNISLIGTIPEPAEAAALFGLAAVLLSAARRRRR